MNLVGVAEWLAQVKSAFARPAQHSVVSEVRGAHLDWQGRAGAWLVALGLVGAQASLVGCNLDNPGTTQPEGELSYPIALAFSSSSGSTSIGDEEAPKFLYVANTNYVVRYNGASVQSYDLERLVARLAKNRCLQRPGPASDAGNDADVDADLDAGDIDAGDLDAGDIDADLEAGGPAVDLDGGDAGDAERDAGDAGDEAGVDGGEDAGDAGTPIAAVDAGGRDVIPADALRGRLCDRRTTPLDVGRDNSGDPEDESVCCFGAKDVMDDLRADEMPIDSYASGMETFTMPDGARDFLYVNVRSRNRLVYIEADPETGKMSCGDTKRCARGPDLDTEALADKDTEFAPQGSAVTSGSFEAFDIDDASYNGFVATAHNQGQVSLFGVTDTGRPELLDVVTATAQRAVALHLDAPTKLLYAGAVSGTSVSRIGVRRGPLPPNLPMPYAAPSLSISGLTGANDVRDVAVDSRPRGPDEPLRAYALIRGGGSSSNFLQSVAFLTLDPRTPDGVFARGVEAVRVGLGPSKLVQATIRGRHLLFASCYDAGEIHVIDADKRQTVTVIRDVLGPFDMKIDQARLLMYVTDFRTSSLRVVDLHGLATRSSRPPVVVATIGVPTTPGKVR